MQEILHCTSDVLTENYLLLDPERQVLLASIFFSTLLILIKVLLSNTDKNVTNQPTMNHQTPHVGRVAQRKKKFNQFYCLIMILGYKRNSKLLFMKKNLEPSWRYHLTHTANSAQIWQNFIAVYHQPSNMAQDFISLLPILSSFFIPKS